VIYTIRSLELNTLVCSIRVVSFKFSAILLIRVGILKEELSKGEYKGILSLSLFLN